MIGKKIVFRYYPPLEYTKSDFDKKHVEKEGLVVDAWTETTGGTHQGSRNPYVNSHRVYLVETEGQYLEINRSLLIKVIHE